jgi:hypothetical protein
MVEAYQCSQRFFDIILIQYLLDLTDHHLADLGFNGPNFGAKRFCKYWTSPVNTRKL